MAAERLAEFKKAREDSEARSLLGLQERIEESRRIQEAEWAARQANEKKALETRLKLLEEEKKVQLDRLTKISAIRRQEEIRERSKVKEALQKAQALAQKQEAEAEAARSEKEKSEKAAAQKKKQEELQGHPVYKSQSDDVKNLLNGMKHSDALEAIGHPVLMLAVQRSSLKKRKQSKSDYQAPAKEEPAKQADTLA